MLAQRKPHLQDFFDVVAGEPEVELENRRHLAAEQPTRGFNDKPLERQKTILKSRGGLSNDNVLRPCRIRLLTFPLVPNNLPSGTTKKNREGQELGNFCPLSKI